MCGRSIRMVEDTFIHSEEFITRVDDSFAWQLCGESKNGSSVFEVSEVTLEPERISRGTTATFRIDARINGDGDGWSGDASVVDMVVHLGGVEVFSEQDPLCDVSSCPIPGQGIDFAITYDRTFPFYTPPGRYHLTMQGHDTAHMNQQVLFCVEIDFTVHFFSET